MAECAIRVVAYPKDSNPDGDMFGGWLLSMMDMAGAIPARRLAKSRVVTVAIDNMKFLRPVFIGDSVECYVEVEKIGKSSITVMVEAFVERRDDGRKEKVTEAKIVYVAIGRDRRPVPIDQ